MWFDEANFNSDIYNVFTQKLLVIFCDIVLSTVSLLEGKLASYDDASLADMKEK